MSEIAQKHILAGQEALARTDWIGARYCFEAAIQEHEPPEVLEFLGLAAWWLDDADTTFKSR